jgi:hypothetical protein
VTDCNRKKKFVDPEVQGTLTRRVLLHWLAFAGVSAVLTFGMHWMSDPFAPLNEVVAGAWWTYSPVFLVLLCMLPLFIVDTIKLSSRFAGPLVRFRRAVSDLADGQPPESIEFRNSDFWREMATDLSRVAKRIGVAETAEPVQHHDTKQLAGTAN